MLAAACIFLSACGRNGRKSKEPEQVVTLYNDTWIIDKYMNALQDYDHVIYEQVYFDWGSRSIGPTEYRFRGVVYLTDAEAERLWSEYEWEQTCVPEFEFEKVDMKSFGEGPWYLCKDFNSDNFKTVNVNYAVFDGERLVFDINQI